jgi:hypothetical protein
MKNADRKITVGGFFIDRLNIKPGSDPTVLQVY